MSEFQVTHRDLYTATDRLPVKDGVLDRRLVRFVAFSLSNVTIVRAGDHRKEYIL
jgi:hypothetical protein